MQKDKDRTLRKARLSGGTAMRMILMGLAVAGVTVFARNHASAQTTSAPAASTASQAPLKAEELDQLVAPIALYPDTLLSEVLMAATYPLEVVEADRWAKQNKGLKGDALKSAADKQTWDQSLKTLTATPDVLDMMSSKLDWTQKLGDAVLAQQPDVMDAIQRLRQKAQANDKLKTTKQQKVTVSKQANKDYIIIEPAVPDTIYVPYYDPAVVYGAWPYPAYPPVFFPAPGYIAGAAIATGLAFGAGYAIGRWASGGNYWGGGVNWGGNSINVNRPININNTVINNWQHNPDHRHGVRYNNDGVRQKFAKGDAGGRDRRMDFRGRGGEQVLRPGGDRPGGDNRPDFNRPGGGDKRPDANRPGGGDRPQKGTRPGSDKASKGPRPGGKDRPSAGNRPNIPGRGEHGGAFNHVDRGGLERIQSNRGHASLGGGGARPQFHGGGRPGGGFHGGGGFRRR